MVNIKYKIPYSQTKENSFCYYIQRGFHRLDFEGITLVCA